jgi:hypothetical protein
MTEKTYTLYSVASGNVAQAYTACWRFGNDLEEVIQSMEIEVGREDMAAFGFVVVEFARPVTMDEVKVNLVNGFEVALNCVGEMVRLSCPKDAGGRIVISQEDSRDYLERRIAETH